MNTPNPETPIVPKQGLIFSENVYKKLKALALVLLPALTTFYSTMGLIWGWPNIEQVVASIAAVDTLLGVLLGISTAAYNRSESRYIGAIDVSYRDADEEGMLPTRVYSLNFGDKDPVEILEKSKEVVFRVNSPE